MSTEEPTGEEPTEPTEPTDEELGDDVPENPHGHDEADLEE